MAVVLGGSFQSEREPQRSRIRSLARNGLFVSQSEAVILFRVESGGFAHVSENTRMRFRLIYMLAIDRSE